MPRSDFAAQSELGSLGYRGRYGLGGANRHSQRRPSACENINPNPGMGGKSSPRLGSFSGAGKSLAPLASSRRQANFGADITNVSSFASKVDKLKPIKHVPQADQAELPKSAPTTAETSPSLTDVQAVCEYANDIAQGLFDKEASGMPQSDYMEIQTDLTPKMRTILMDWLIEVHMKYKLSPETLHLTVNLIDRYLTKMLVMRKKLQLVGVAAMSIASKYEEIHPPEISDWVYICDKAYTRDDVLNMECTMLSVLQFNIMVPTAAHFFPILQKANDCTNIHSKLAQYIVELSILDGRMLQYKPSMIVSAALLLSNEVLGYRPLWSQHMVQQSHHTEASLQSCVDVLRQLFDADRTGSGGQLRAVHKKFSQKENSAVATMRF